MNTFNVILTSVNLFFWIIIIVFSKRILSNIIKTVQQVSLGNIKKEVDKILIEIDKVTDRDLSLIENRIKTLREVIDLADKRILMAGKELEKQEREIETIKQINLINENSKKDNATIKGKVENAYKINKAKKHDGGISLFAAEEIEEKPMELSLKDKVLNMFNQGIDVYLIAEKLDSSVAEVQTIINLFGH